MDGLRFKVTEYNPEFVRMVSIELKKDDPDEDTVDVKALKSLKSVNSEENGQLGFDLMSLTARRGHFVDHVRTLK